MKINKLLFLLAFLGSSLGVNPALAQNYTNFESGPVRPMALTNDGNRLLVTNIPDAHLEVFDFDLLTVNQFRIHEGAFPLAVPVAVVRVRAFRLG